MKIACEKCGTVFDVDASQVPSSGLQMKCTSCFHSFLVPPATLDLSGEENNDFILTNSPDDFAAPSGYVDPTTKDITAYEEIPDIELGGPSPAEIMDLPGLPQARPPAEITDLPGLPRARPAAGRPQARPPADRPQAHPPADIMDLPGLPQARRPAEITDLPGLPRRKGAEEITDLPGLPGRQRVEEVLDLPGLPRPRAGSEVSDLPGLPSQQQHAPMDLADLPGLPSSGPGAGLPDLPGLPTAGPTDLPGLPTKRRDAPTPSTSGMDYGEVSLDTDDGLSVDLDDIPVDTEEPVVGLADLPAPATSRQDIPAVDFDLPTPVRPSKPAPAREVSDLPRPKPVQAAPLEEMISFEAPPIDEPVDRAAIIEPEAPQPEPSTPKAAPKGRMALPSKKVMIAAVAAVVIVLGGGLAALLLVGGGGKGAASSKRQLAEGQLKMRLDTFAGYAQAASEFQQAASKLDDEAKEQALAWQAQALAARAIRFGFRATLSDAQVIADKLGGKDKAPHPTRLTNALLELAHGKVAAAQSQLEGLSNAKPKDAFAALYLGWAQLAAKNLPAAQTAFERAVTADGRLSGALFGLAQTQARSNNAQAALASCDKVLAQNSAHAGAILLKAALLMKKEQPEQARPLAQRVMALMRSGAASRPELARAHAIAAQIALVKGDVNAARADYAKALTFDPQSRDALVGSAKLAVRAKRFGEATGFLRRAKALAPTDVETTLLLAESMLALGRPVDARDALQATRAAHPNNPRVHFVLGRIEDTLEAHPNAIAAYKQAIKLDPKYFAPYLYLSRLYLRRKETSLAFGVLTQADTILKNAQVRNAMGEAHYLSGELKKARTKFEEALAMDPKLDVALFNLANTLRDEGRQEAALAQYQLLEKRDRSFPGLAAALGKLYMSMGQAEKAAQIFLEALKVDRPSVALRLQAARAFVSAGKYDECFKQAASVLRDKPTSAEARALRAEANVNLGKANDALVEIRHAVERDNKAHYHAVMAQAYEQLGKLGEALLAYNAALKLDPKEVDYQLQRARVQVRAGAVKDGLKALEALIAKHPKLAAAQLYRGVALIDLGKEAQGRAALNAAIALDPKLAEAHFRLALMALDAHQEAKAFSHLAIAAANGKPRESWLPDALFRYGQLAAQRGAKTQAIESLTRFLGIAPARDANRPVATQLLKKLGVKPAPARR